MVIKLDYDGRRLALGEMVRRAERANITLVRIWQRRSASGRGWHRVVVVKPAPTSAMQVVALQLLFGSDPLREAYIYNRARAVDGSRVARYWLGRHTWNVLYRGRGPWRRVEGKLLAAHRERTGRRARQPRAN